MTSVRLKNARRNTALLLAVLYLSDIFWLVVSRSNFVIGRYKLAAFDWVYFGFFVALSIAFCLVAVFISCYARPFPRFRVSSWFILLLIAFAIGLNVLSMLVVDPAARYRGGSFTAFSWVVHVLSTALSLGTVMLIIRENETGKRISLKWMLGLLASYALTIDGMASALTLFMFIFLMFGFGRFSIGKTLMAVGLAAGLFFVGFHAKFKDVPDYVTPDFIVQWVSARFSVQAEQMYTYISGNSVVGNEVSYLDLITRAASNRIDLVSGDFYIEEKPKNISEAMSYDMHGAYIDSGSSPGILVNTAMQGPIFFIVVPAFFAFFFIQHFYGVLKRLSIAEIIAYSFCFKVLHSNFASMFSIVTPSVISMVVFFGFCIITSGRSNSEV